MRRAVMALSAVVLLFGPGGSASAQAPDEVTDELPGIGTRITILHDTHMHGLYRSRGLTIAQYLGFVRERKEANEHALFLGSGDDFAGRSTQLAEQFGGAHMVDALNESVIDYDTFGNHDFDYGPGNVRKLVDASRFTWVSANVRDRASGAVFAEEQGAKRFDIVEMGGVQVGITGLGPRGMAALAEQVGGSLGDDTEQIHDIEAMEEVVPQMRDAGADLVIVASHLCSPNARELAEAVDGIDAIVGDHCSLVQDEPDVVNDTIISLAGDEFAYLGELTFEVVAGVVTDHEFVLHELHPGDPPPEDPGVQEVVEDYERRRATRFADVPGTHVHASGISWAHEAGIAGGYADGTYRANRPVTRGQMATFLVRALDLPPADNSAGFTDVPPGSPHADAIDRVNGAGIATGYADGTYRPNKTVGRAQMATFLQRGFDLPAGSVARFDDIQSDHVHASGIGATARAHITAGCEPKRYCPADDVSRGQMATFLMRASR